MMSSLLRVSSVLQKLSGGGGEGAPHHLHLLFCKTVYTSLYTKDVKHLGYALAFCSKMKNNCSNVNYYQHMSFIDDANSRPAMRIQSLLWYRHCSTLFKFHNITLFLFDGSTDTADQVKRSCSTDLFPYIQ